MALTPEVLSNWNPDGTGKVRRPVKRWMEDVIVNLIKMLKKNWKEIVNVNNRTC